VEVVANLSVGSDIVDAMSSDAAIEVRGLRKSYGGREVLAGLDLTVDKGEVFALLGPNGAGKTTTVEILEGYRRRDGGEATVLGVDPAKGGAAWRARVGIVPQSTGQFDALTVGEVVRLFAGYYPAADDPAAVIERVGLTDKARAQAHALSGGQRRRLDVALGIIGRPELLFLDEPTTGFDPQARRDFWGLVRDLAAAGTTILLTTHYLDEAEELADRVAVIAGGRLMAVAPPAELGGRDNTQATVSWIEPDGPRSARTDTPTAFVRQLVSRFGGAEIPGLTVTRPTLEETYLEMISEVAE
jgi:ABC-2 type transport system ATP-binding protein